MRNPARRVGAWGGTLLLALAALAVEAGTKPRIPTFGASVEVVSLNLVVTDARGRQVPGLTPEDIELLEDGVSQPISLFTQEEWPVRLQVLLDASGSMGEALPFAKRAARRLLRTLRRGDTAEVAQFNRRLSVLQEPTGDMAALEASVERVTASGDTALYNALYLTLREPFGSHADADELSRRAIVVLTDGEDTASLVDDEQLLDLARHKGVAVYAIGLPSRPPVGRPASTLPAYFLTALARETGGRAYFPRSLDELEGVYERIASELRALYGIGYVPLDTRPDGRWRRLFVRPRQANLLVRHRSGYFAAREGIAERASR